MEWKQYKYKALSVWHTWGFITEMTEYLQEVWQYEVLFSFTKYPVRHSINFETHWSHQVNPLWSCETGMWKNLRKGRKAQKFPETVPCTSSGSCFWYCVHFSGVYRYIGCDPALKISNLPMSTYCWFGDTFDSRTESSNSSWDSVETQKYHFSAKIKASFWSICIFCYS